MLGSERNRRQGCLREQGEEDEVVIGMGMSTRRMRRVLRTWWY